MASASRTTVYAAIVVLAVKATCCAGRFAALAILDRSARRWLIGHHVLLVSDRGLSAGSRTKGHGRQNATSTKRSHREAAVA
jgi:hypothetical protein